MKGKNMLFGFILAVFILLLSIKASLVTKALYYFDIEYLNIEESSGFSKEVIKENYDYVINYLLNPFSDDFHLPSMKYSKEGKIHFEDVKKIFVAIDIMALVSGGIVLLGFLKKREKKDKLYMKYTSDFLILIASLPLVLIFFDFESTFTLFHKIFFRNDYWLFDWRTDPIIEILPMEYFMHEAIFIVLLVVLSATIFRIIYKKNSQSEDVQVFLLK